MSSRKNDACKVTTNLHFLIPQRTRKRGDGRAVVLGVGFFVGIFFFWPPLA